MFSAVASGCIEPSQRTYRGQGELSVMRNILPVAQCHGGPEVKVKHESPVAKMVISAGCTWVFELMCVHYFECLKIAKQTSDISYAGITRNLVQHKGIVGVLDGFFPWGSLQAVAKGGAFGLGHAAAKKVMHDVGVVDANPRASEVLAGGLGGAVQGVVLSPVLLLKTRVITDPSYRASGGLIETAKMSSSIGVQVIKKEGTMALTKGLPIFVTKRFFDWTTRFLFVEVVEHTMEGNDPTCKLSTGQKYFASFAGGTLSALSTIPLDVMVALQQSASSAGRKDTSAMTVLKEKYAEGGIATVTRFGTRGLGARVVHVALTTILMKTMAAEVYKLYAGAA